ncbi:MAG: universal stress protein [Anaerolineae bacterium]|jgi:nucleotide-binding universal stress UspA family protein|nr:universal stress protein [Anaerolineae bacterium]
MYRKILLPFDTGGVPETVARHVIALAAAHGAALSGLRVIPVVSSGEAFFDKIQVELGSRGAKLREEAESEFNRLARLGQEAGIAFSGEVVFTEKPEAEAIVTYAAEHDCDLIVLPTRPRTALSRWLMGNVEDKVRRRSRVPVLFVPAAADA